VDRIRKKYPQNLPGEESEQIESYEETVAKDDLPNESIVFFSTSLLNFAISPYIV
jgi:hypothetical protein